MTNGQQDYLVKVGYDIPFGKCLGSSAAFNTVLATLLLGLFDKIHFKELDAKAKEMINSLSV